MPASPRPWWQRHSEPQDDKAPASFGLTVGGATTIHNAFKVDGNTILDGSLELNSTLIDINGSVATGKTDYRLSSVGTGVSWRPPGVETTNILYVTKDGNENLTKKVPSDPAEIESLMS